jgi:SAM-dependent methyltransferase
METAELVERTGSLVDPLYSTGTYFDNPDRHSEDARFKADHFTRLLRKVIQQNRYPSEINSYIDVGCGSGAVVKLVSETLKKDGVDLQIVKGYDISPHVQHLRHESIEFHYRDFCQSNEFVDLVTLFDVFEHVPDPIRFIRQVSQRCRLIGFHIPLDHTWSVSLRDAFRSRLENPGHLIFMDTAFALNVITLSGLRVLDYAYTLNHLAPSGRGTLLRKLMLPIRHLIGNASPWLLSKTLGGASLMVIAATPHAFSIEPGAQPPQCLRNSFVSE